MMMGDYSFLIDSIEGNIQSALPSKILPIRESETPRRKTSYSNVDNDFEFTGGERKRSRDGMLLFVLFFHKLK